MASERRVSWALLVKVAAWLLLCLLTVAAGRWWYEGQYGLAPLPRDWGGAVSTSPGGEWQLRSYYYSFGGITEGADTWAEVRARGSARWRRIYDGPGASVSWADANTVVFTEGDTSAKHRVDARTGDYGVMPHGTFEEVSVWVGIVYLSLALLGGGATLILFAPRIIARARLARARRRGAAESRT